MITGLAGSMADAPRGPPAGAPGPADAPASLDTPPGRRYGSDVRVFSGWKATRRPAGPVPQRPEGAAMNGEFRKDPATGKWVLVRRPGTRPWEGNGEACPFCPGNERLTPDEITAYRPARRRATEAGVGAGGAPL